MFIYVVHRSGEQHGMLYIDCQAPRAGVVLVKVGVG